jgi:hypothetical protein
MNGWMKLNDYLAERDDPAMDQLVVALLVLQPT